MTNDRISRFILLTEMAIGAPIILKITYVLGHLVFMIIDDIFNSKDYRLMLPFWMALVVVWVVSFFSIATILALIELLIICAIFIIGGRAKLVYQRPRLNRIALLALPAILIGPFLNLSGHPENILLNIPIIWGYALILPIIHLWLELSLSRPTSDY